MPLLVLLTHILVQYDHLIMAKKTKSPPQAPIRLTTPDGVRAVISPEVPVTVLVALRDKIAARIAQREALRRAQGTTPS